MSEFFIQFFELYFRTCPAMFFWGGGGGEAYYLQLPKRTCYICI